MAYELGRLFKPDPNDRKFPMRAQLPADVVERTIVYPTGPVLDQGAIACPFADTTHPFCKERGFCVGAAWRQLLTSAPVVVKGGPGLLDVYHAAQDADEWEGGPEAYAGSSVRAGAKVLQRLGYIGAYLWADGARTVRDWMCAGKGGVVVGSLWCDGMNEPTKETGYTVKLTGHVRGGHAYYLPVYSKPRGAYRILNSWGRTWGENGRAWLLGEDLERLIGWDGECCTPHEIKLNAGNGNR